MEMDDVKNKPSKVCILIWRIVNLIMFVFFLCCTAVQHNDPDPNLWMPLYGIPSLLFLSIAAAPSLQGKIGWRILAGLELVYCIAMLTYTALFISEETLAVPHGKNPLHYEEGREMAGLGIVISWTMITLFYNPNVPRNESWSHCKTTLIFGGIVTTSLVPCLLWLLCYISELAQYVKFCSLMCSDKHVDL